MGQRYVELFLSPQPDAARARAAGAHAAGADGAAAAAAYGGAAMHGGCAPSCAALAAPPPGPQPLASASLKLRGMPYAATADDVANFFAGYALVREAIALGPQPGQASVAFHSVPEAARALAERNRQHMGSRYIELFAQ